MLCLLCHPGAVGRPSTLCDVGGGAQGTASVAVRRGEGVGLFANSRPWGLGARGTSSVQDERFPRVSELEVLGLAWQVLGLGSLETRDGRLDGRESSRARGYRAGQRADCWLLLLAGWRAAPF